MLAQSVNYVTLVALVLLAYPIGYISRRICSIVHKQLFLLTLGFAFCYMMYGLSFFYVLIGDVLLWCSMYIPGKYCIVGLLVPICGLFIIHYQRLEISGSWKSDISGLVMFSSLRGWMTLMNVYDNRHEIKRDYWKVNALKEPPNMFSFLVYMFCPIGLISGPLVPFRVFEETLFLPFSEDDVSLDLKKGLKPYFYSVIFMISYGISLLPFPTGFMLKEEFNSKPIILKFIICAIYSFSYSSRYPFAWLGGEAGLFSFGVCRAINHDPENCRSFRIEVYYSKHNAGQLVNEWNHSVHIFLKENIHCRILSIGGNKLLAKFVTFVFSAYWHGFFPGYYIYAMIVMLFGIVDSYRHKLTNHVLTPLLGEKGSFVFDFLHTHLINFFNAATWDLLWLKPCIQFHLSMKFLPYIYEGVLIMLCQIIYQKTKYQWLSTFRRMNKH